MKTTMTLLMSFLTIIASCQDTKEKKVPQSVMANFQQKYPDENNPEWEIDANGNWEAQFKVNGEKYRADFLPNGLWIETENSIKKKNLPDAIKKAIHNDYSDRKITEVERVTHHSKGLFYDVEFKQKGKNKDVEYREDGTVVK